MTPSIMSPHSALEPRLPAFPPATPSRTLAPSDAQLRAMRRLMAAALAGQEAARCRVTAEPGIGMLVEPDLGAAYVFLDGDAPTLSYFLPASRTDGLRSRNAAAGFFEATRRRLGRSGAPLQSADAEGADFGRSNRVRRI